jgi:hypothetical protein
MSMCRTNVNVLDLENGDEVDASAKADLYKYLKADALGASNRCVGFNQNGISIMLFGC